MARRHSQEDVELNVAAMLDMAFQLLTFFILTFRPPPAEGQIAIRMPPAQAVVGGGQMKAGDNDKIAATEVKPVVTLVVTVVSQSGKIDYMVGVPSLGMNPVPTLTALEAKLNSYFKDQNSPFEQVIVQANSEVPWGEFMRVIEICSSQKFSNGKPLDKLSIERLDPET